MSVSGQKKSENRVKARLSRQKKLESRARKVLQQRTPLIILNDKKDYVSNSCGPCTACCTVIGVAALKKPMWTPCEHQCGSGCLIHGKHPQECKDYYCMYQGGFLKGGEDMRPDKLGIIIESRGPDDLPFLMLWEVWKDASQQEKVQVFIHKLLEIYGGRPIVVRKYQSTTGFLYYGSQKYYKQIVAILAEGYKIDQQTLGVGNV